jgi:DNA-binding MarR family transcriptional regulator
VAPDELPRGLPDDLANLWYLVRRAAAVMDREGDLLCRHQLGISLAQFLVLSVVDAYPGHLSQQAIADRLGLTKGTVSRQIDAAVAAGLLTVQVAAHTRRENAVALTAAGTALVRKGDAVMLDSRTAMAGAVTPAKLHEVIVTLRSLLQTLTHGDPM